MGRTGCLTALAFIRSKDLQESPIAVWYETVLVGFSIACDKAHGRSRKQTNWELLERSQRSHRRHNNGNNPHTGGVFFLICPRSRSPSAHPPPNTFCEGHRQNLRVTPKRLRIMRACSRSSRRGLRLVSFPYALFNLVPFAALNIRASQLRGPRLIPAFSETKELRIAPIVEPGKCHRIRHIFDGPSVHLVETGDRQTVREQLKLKDEKCIGLYSTSFFKPVQDPEVLLAR
jgi:hypothetical protein